jgi:PAS domain S-box-containing protein
VEHRLRRADGQFRWHLTQACLWPESAVRCRCWLGTSADVDDRRRAEESLPVLAGLIDSTDDAVVSVSLEGTILTWNPAAERIFGYTALEAVGRPVVVLAPPGEREATCELIDRTGRGESIPLYQAAHVRKDGSAVAVAVRAVAIRGADDGPRALLVTYRDVTAWAEMESALKTADDQRRQAQKMEAVGRLAGGIAHDFNNLLTVITGYGEFLLESLRPGDPAREFASEMKRAGERAAGLTHQLLAFSRQQPLTPQLVDLNSIVTDTGRMLRRVIGEDVHLEQDLAPDLWPVFADAGSTEQVLMNLAVNARDAMPRGGKLTITTRNVEPDGQVLLAVSDTGTGMTPEVRARIFEPFFTTKEKGQGTGLGLATVYGIVERTGGRIDVRSEVGRGTTFRVYLPRTERASLKGKSHHGEPLLPHGTETILVAEDEPSVRDLAVCILRKCGYHVLEAGSAREAVRESASHRGDVHLLLTDVVMPVTAGREVAELLRAERPALKVLYLSGYTNDAVASQGVSRESVRFLQKPFTPSTLARAVREALDAVVPGS